MLADKLTPFINRYNELGEMLSSPDILSDIKRMTSLSKERSSLENIVEKAQEYKSVIAQIGDTKEMLGDPEMAEMAKEELKELEAKITSPRAVRYIGLVREFDSLVAKFDILWLSGSIPDSSYSVSLYEWKRRLLRVSGGMRSLAGRAITAAKRKEPMPTESPSGVPVTQVVPLEAMSPISVPVV